MYLACFAVFEILVEVNDLLRSGSASQGSLLSIQGVVSDSLIYRVESFRPCFNFFFRN